MVDYTEMAIEVLAEHHPKGLHVNELSVLVLKKYQNLQISKEDLAAKYSNKFSSEFIRNGRLSRFQNIKNRQGKYRKGIYRLKKEQVSESSPR